MKKQRINYIGGKLNSCTIYVLIVALIGCIFSTHASNPPALKWVVNHPFEQKVVIENKGQYSIEGKVASKDILYGARQGGLFYYFTANSIWIKRIVPVKRTEQEIEALKVKMGENGKHGEGEEDDEKELAYKQVDEFHEISFSGANSTADLTTDNAVSWYYNFTTNGNVPVKAHAWKKLTYRNLYPGIDMEFYFPEDKEGFEYSFIVHPGADVSQIKIQYPLDKGIQVDKNNNIVVQSAFGNFTEHAPVATQGGKVVESSFFLIKSTSGFGVKAYDKTQNLVIDPWVITPTFAGTNDAYDLDWDNAGDCYVYGGSYPFQLIKYNSSGSMLWSYTENFVNNNYGGFAVDRNSQSSYIVDGFMFPQSDTTTLGTQVIKVNGSGTVVATFVGNYVYDNDEMWRIAFNACDKLPVIASGGITVTQQACTIDTNLTNYTPVNVLNTDKLYQDMVGIALDDYGNCYMSTSGNGQATITTNNVIIKLPLPSITPTTWDVSDGYNFVETGSITYYPGYSNDNSNGNGFNGMTVSNTDLYTYDSYVLKKWNSVTGAAINSVTVNVANDNSLMYWGGLTSNACDNIFVGSQTNIQQYDGNLNLVNTITGSSSIYDVKLGPDNILYACGAGFVEAMQVSLPSCHLIKVQNHINNTICTNPTSGSDTLILSGGRAPYNISWNTTPVQTGDTLSNVPAGTYIAKISDLSCSQGYIDTVFDTVTVTMAGLVNRSKINVCIGNSVTLTAPSGATNYTWYPSTGLSSTVGSAVIANPKTSTVYSVICSSNNCVDTVNILAKVNPLPVISVTPDIDTICANQSVSITASGASTYGWSPSAGLSATSGMSVTASPTLTTHYEITGIDSNGCQNSTTADVNVTALVVSPPQTVCSGQTVTLTASGMDTYEWYPPTGLSSTTGDSVIAAPVVNTTYTVTGSTTNGCPNQTAQTIVTVIEGPNKPTITRNGDVLTSSATQGNQWALNDTVITGATNRIYTITQTGCYTVTAVNPANGCSTISDTFCVTSLTGINQLSINSDQLSIYPNPTTGEIILDISSSVGEVEDWSLQITDVLGRTLYIKPSLNYSNAIDLSHLAGGVYFVTVMNSKRRVVVPIVKQ